MQQQQVELAVPHTLAGLQALVVGQWQQEQRQQRQQLEDEGEATAHKRIGLGRFPAEW
jgi:hypothetical protein